MVPALPMFAGMLSSLHGVPDNRCRNRRAPLRTERQKHLLGWALRDRPGNELGDGRSGQRDLLPLR